MGGTDVYFVESQIGIPTTFVYMEYGTGLHHNSRDTIEKVDSRSLHDLSMTAALALYYTANAGYDDIPLLAPLTCDRGAAVILQKTREMENRAARAGNGEELGAARNEGVRVIGYYTGLQVQALRSILRVVEPERRGEAERRLSGYIWNMEELGQLMVKQFDAAVDTRAAALSIRLSKHGKKESAAELEAASLYPKAEKIGTLTLEGIPPEEWRNLTGSPRWWSPRNWAAASYWWCDGTRNLQEIKELVELEAGASAANFDFVAYYRFLEKHGLVRFVKPGKK
jgi:hypothetical protein